MSASQKGGVGCAKTGGNYAASFKAARDANSEGFNEVLWLDGREQKYVQEVGAMNMMFMIDDTCDLGVIRHDFAGDHA